MSLLRHSRFGSHARGYYTITAVDLAIVLGIAVAMFLVAYLVSDYLSAVFQP